MAKKNKKTAKPFYLTTSMLIGYNYFFMRRRILVVDDDNTVRESIGVGISKSYEVLFAENGDRCIKSFDEPAAVDLVILDINLPDIEGIDVLRRIRGKGVKIPVIIISAYGSKGLLKKAIPLGIIGYFDKPFNLYELLEQINKALTERFLNEDIPFPISIKEKIEVAKKMIEEKHNMLLSLKEIAKEVGVEPKYFSRCFKEVVGEGFYNYRTKKKVEKIKELLINSDYTISQICSEVDYSEISCLTKVFKKFTGINPTEYRKRNVIYNNKFP